MKDTIFQPEASPWLDTQLSWDELTEGLIAQTFTKGHMFFEQGEYCDNAFLIKRGRVSMYVSTPDGNLRTVMVVDANGVFGTHPFFDQCPNYYRAQVSTETAEIYVIPKQMLLEKMEPSSQTLRNAMIQCVRGSRLLTVQLELMTFGSSMERVCFFLLHMAEQYSVEKDSQKKLLIRFTHQEIADLTGLSRVYVSNIISSLIKEGIVAKNEGVYWILREDLLREKIKYYKAN